MPRWITCLISFAAVIAGALAQEEAVKTDCNNWSERFQKNLEGICVCTSNVCDSISNEYLNVTLNQASLYRTTKAGERLKHSRVPLLQTDGTTPVDFVVDSSVRFQQIIGFGGAFTDATAINLYKTKPELQQQILDAYYSENGLQYTIGRVPIASTDFSESVYSYNPVVDDLEMEHFSIDVDKAPNSHKLDLIHRALNTSSRELKLFASSWAPPVWMTRENHTEYCTLKGEPGDKYWKALALYYSKFFDAYAQEGIKFWAMTTQNEPKKQLVQLTYWQSLKFSAELERDFIKKDLGPLMRQNHPDLKIIMMDDQKNLMFDRQAPLQDAESRQYVAGIGVHWYDDQDFILPWQGNFGDLTKFHLKYPEVFILGTEACEGFLPSFVGTGNSVRLQEPKVIWQRAENYGRDIINDLGNYVAGWTDWNLVVDTHGGPNWAKNVVDAPIVVDEQGGNEFYKQPMYYVLGHIAKFVPPRSLRVDLRLRQDNLWNQIKFCSVDRAAFLTPENRLVLIFFNRNGKSMSVRVALPKGLLVALEMPPNSIQTLIVSEQ